MGSSFRMAGERPVQPDKTVSRASTLASTLWRVRVFPARLIVVGGVPRPYMFACDMPPDRLGDARQSCVNGNGNGATSLSLAALIGRDRGASTLFIMATQRIGDCCGRRCSPTETVSRD